MFEQERIIVRLQQKVNATADITVCFLSGSYGRRMEDGFSDLDVALVFENERQRDAVWDKRRAFVQEVTPYVPAKSFDALHIRPFFHIALYSNGSKVDYRFETKALLTPNPWDRDIRILKDAAGWATQYQIMCGQAMMPQPRISVEELQALDERFWIMFWDVFRLLLRGEQDKPFTIYLELLQFTLPPLLNVLPPEDAARKGLLFAQFGKDTGKTAVHLKTFLHAYLAARSAIVRRLHLDFTPNSRFENGIVQLVERKAK